MMKYLVVKVKKRLRYYLGFEFNNKYIRRTIKIKENIKIRK